MSALAAHIHDDLLSLFGEQIPLSKAMGLTIESLHWDRIHLSAPLAPNVNDKGTAFGGSLSAALTLAGWGLLYGRLAHDGIEADLVIHRSEIIYERPVSEDFNIYCDGLASEDWLQFTRQLGRRGRARVVLKSWVSGASHAAAVMTGTFVALKK